MFQNWANTYIYGHRIPLIYEYWYYVIPGKTRDFPPLLVRCGGRILVNAMEVRVGTRVIRGPHWTWRDQDGGEGHLGSVAEVQLQEPAQGEEGRAPTRDPPGPRACAVTVQWDCGNRCRYRCGLGGKYDLRVFDSGPAGWSPQGRGIIFFKLETSFLFILSVSLLDTGVEFTWKSITLFFLVTFSPSFAPLDSTSLLLPPFPSPPPPLPSLSPPLFSPFLPFLPSLPPLPYRDCPQWSDVQWVWSGPYHWHEVEVCLLP